MPRRPYACCPASSAPQNPSQRIPAAALGHCGRAEQVQRFAVIRDQHAGSALYHNTATIARLNLPCGLRLIQLHPGNRPLQ